MGILACYIRVSTEEQAHEGNSLVEQEEQLKRFAVGNGFDDTYRIYRDEGYSARSLERPAMQKLLLDVSSGHVTGVVTTRIDRLTRRVGDFARLIELFNEHGVFYRSTRQNFEVSTAMGRMMATILSAIAEFEREMIAERVYENLLSKAKQNSLTTKPPFGYQLVNGMLEPHPGEAVWVRKAADRLLRGAGTRQVARYLNDHGVRTKTGRLWSDATVRTLFRNEVLTGTLIWNRRAGSGKGRRERKPEDWVVAPDHHVPLLTRGEFDAIQQLIDRRRRMQARARSGSRLLSGIVTCGFCGAPMHGGWQIYDTKAGKQRKKTYRCSTYVRTGTCVINRVDAEDLDDFVVRNLMKWRDGNLSAQRIAWEAESVAEESVVELKRKVAQYNQRIERLFDALSLGIIRPEEFRNQRERLEQERGLAERELDDLTVPTKEIPGGKDEAKFSWEQRLSRLQENLDDDEEARRAAVLELVDEVRVYRKDWRNEPEVEITYRI